jgi:ABC-type Mn2+/Zn2+ transport system permease subunit
MSYTESVAQRTLHAQCLFVVLPGGLKVAALLREYSQVSQSFGHAALVGVSAVEMQGLMQIIACGGFVSISVFGNDLIDFYKA